MNEVQDTRKTSNETFVAGQLHLHHIVISQTDLSQWILEIFGDTFQFSYAHFVVNRTTAMFTFSRELENILTRSTKVCSVKKNRYRSHERRNKNISTQE